MVGMPYRKIVFANTEFYHIFNRTVGNTEALSGRVSLKRFIDLIDYHRFKHVISYSKLLALNQHDRKVFIKKIQHSPPLVDILAFACMPNHFHFLIKQRQDHGIKIFLSNLQNSFAKYYNTKNERHGTLFENMFKAVRVETMEQLIHLSRYIHLNPVTAYMFDINKLDDYPFTSFATYMGNVHYDFIETGMISDHFVTRERYREFVYDQVDYQRKLKKIERLVFK